MTVYGMVAFIVFIVMISLVVMKGMSTRSRSKQGQAREEAANARIDALEERVRVLEKIATDKGARLSAEIDSL